MKTLWKYALVSIATIASTGCTLLGRPREGVTSYAPTLSTPTAEVVSDGREPAWQIAVAEPQTPASLLGTRILVSPEPGCVEVYRDARWQDPPAILLQALLIQGLGDAGIAGAASDASLQRADFVLESDLLRLQAEYRGAIAPTTALRAHVRLIRVTDGKVVAARLFAIDEPAAASPVPCVVDAFTRAMNRFVRDASDWTVKAGNEAWARAH
jgi:cholesterol transport system auxiliary component